MRMGATSPSRIISPPIPRTRLIGREDACETARAFLLEAAVPLLTLTGPGGVGKTHLALAIAQDVRDAFTNGVVWVDCAPLTDPALLPVTLAHALGVKRSTHRESIDQLLPYLREQQLLMIFENCEHMIAPVADLVATLLAGSPAVQAVATSRAPLRIRGEQILVVEPLPLPAQSDMVSRDDLLGNAAVALFVDRAQSVQPGFALTPQNVATVAAIVHHLDGLPLALELAAARLRILSPAELLTHLQDYPTVLSGGARDAPTRHQTLTDTIAWSYDLLPPTPQRLLRLLAVFTGGWTLQTAGEVSGCEPGDILEALEILVDQSLVRRMPGNDAARFTMLETIRAFAHAQLAEVERDQLLAYDRHAAVFQDLATRASPDLVIGRLSTGWLSHLDTERDNLRVALAWGIEHHQAERALLTCAALSEYWDMRGDFREGRRWTEKALALPPEGTSPGARLGALYALTTLAASQNDCVAAAAAGQEMLRLAEQSGDSFDRMRGHFALSYAALHCDGDHTQALTHARIALDLARERADEPWMAWTLHALGEMPDYDGSAVAAEEATSLFRELGSEWGLVNALNALALHRIHDGDTTAAVPLLLESLGLRRTLNDGWGTVENLVATALLLSQAGLPSEAVRLLGAASRWADELGYGIASSYRVSVAELHDHIQGQVTAEAFAQEWQAGSLMPLDDARRMCESLLVTLVHMPSTHPPLGQARSSPAIPAGGIEEAFPSSSAQPQYDLSRREREVLRLLCQRHTNAEIAETLFIGIRTVESHVSNLLSKLGVPDRRAAAALAARQHLV